MINPNLFNATNASEAEVRELHTILHQQYMYHPWNDQQQIAGAKIRDALMHAAFIVILNAPPCPDRTAALRKLREARMDTNSAITHNGKY